MEEVAVGSVEEVGGAGLEHSPEEVGGAGWEPSSPVIAGGADEDVFADARDRPAEPVACGGRGVAEGPQEVAVGVEEVGGAGVLRPRVVERGADEEVCADARDRVPEPVVLVGRGFEEGPEEEAAGGVEEVGRPGVVRPRVIARGAHEEVCAGADVCADGRDRPAEVVAAAGCGMEERVQEGAAGAVEQIGGAGGVGHPRVSAGGPDEDV